MVPGILYEGLGVAGFSIKVSAPVLQEKLQTPQKRRNVHAHLVSSELSNLKGKPRCELVDFGCLDH